MFNKFDDKYYQNKLPMFLYNQSDYLQYYSIFTNLANDVQLAIETIIKSLDLEYLRSLPEFNVHQLDILDKLGSLVGVSREFELPPGSIIFSNGSTRITQVYYGITLTNIQMYRLIKIKIIKNNYDGSYIQLQNNYTKLFDDININIRDGEENNQVIISWNSQASSVTDVDRTLFLNEYYTIKSVGVNYIHTFNDSGYVFQWDSANDKWDQRNWTQ